ncbi:MAG: hypothetical protein HRU71_09320 [Planctomycetia bacterium]|nr:MAG: hypothetical protein HRU71_09320 [Planctomycetia bacterium]
MSAALHTDPRVDATAAAIEAVNLSQILVSQARSVAAERGSNKQQVEALVSLLEEAARVQERWGRVDDEWRMRLAGIVHHTPKTWQAFAARSFHELAIEMLECVRGWIVSVVVGIPSFQQLPGNAVDLAVRSLASCHSQVIEWADAIQIDTMAHRAVIEEERAGAVRDFAGTASDAEHRLGFNPNHALALLGVVARLQDEKPLPDDPHDTTDHYIPCNYEIMKWMEAKHGCSSSEYANLERELVGLGYLIREPAYNATLLEITRSGRRVLATGEFGGVTGGAPASLDGLKTGQPINIEIDELNQIIRMGSKVCRFGGSELWAVFIRVWKARPVAVNLDEVSGREGRAVAAELKDHFRRNGFDVLADAVKNQRGMGYYIELPDTTE